MTTNLKAFWVTLKQLFELLLPTFRFNLVTAIFQMS